MRILRILGTAVRLGKQNIQPRENRPSLVVLAACTVVLSVATCLTPDPHGYGTHQQIHLPPIAGVTFRLPPCAFHSLTGLPCPTCGMTTAFAHGIRGQFREAFLAQPFGLVLFILTVATALDCGVFLCTGRTLRQLPLPWKRIALVLLAMWILAWSWKIIEAWKAA